MVDLRSGRERRCYVRMYVGMGMGIWRAMEPWKVVVNSKRDGDRSQGRASAGGWDWPERRPLRLQKER